MEWVTACRISWWNFCWISEIRFKKINKLFHLQNMASNAAFFSWEQHQRQLQNGSVLMQAVVYLDEKINLCVSWKWQNFFHICVAIFQNAGRPSAKKKCLIKPRFTYLILFFNVSFLSHVESFSKELSFLFMRKASYSSQFYDRLALKFIWIRELCLFISKTWVSSISSVLCLFFSVLFFFFYVDL